MIIFLNSYNLNKVNFIDEAKYEMFLQKENSMLKNNQLKNDDDNVENAF